MSNRPNCININCAVANSDGKAEFICNEGYTEMISGLKATYDERHFARLDHEKKNHGGTTRLIEVETKKLETILHNYGVNHIHYLSIDVEGAEFEVIKSINFDKVFIDVIGFEDNYKNSSVPIVEFLKEKGYMVIYSFGDIIMLHQNSRFIPRSRGFIFYPCLDSVGDDLQYVGKQPIERLMELCESNHDCMGFNTLGFLKKKIKPLADLELSNYFKEGAGVYLHEARRDAK